MLSATKRSSKVKSSTEIFMKIDQVSGNNRAMPLLRLIKS